MSRITKATPEEFARYVRARHEVDRTQYDTPGSVCRCPCDDCNRVRRIYGRQELSKNWVKVRETYEVKKYGQIRYRPDCLQDVHLIDHEELITHREVIYKP